MMNPTRKLAPIALGALVLGLLAPSRSADGHETDQFTLPPGREFMDFGDYLTRWAYQAIADGVEATNTKIRQARSRGQADRVRGFQTPDAIADAVNNEFPYAVTLIESLESMVHKPAWKQRYPGQVVGYKERITNTFANVHFILDPRQFSRIFFASTINAFGVHFGVDKVGHFTDMGDHYYRTYRAALKKGKSEEQALASAIRRGTSDPLMSESSLLGVMTSGAYSNADLVSDIMGMMFYKNLSEEVVLDQQRRPPMLTLEDGLWTIAPHVRPDSDFFSYFFPVHLDEALNPSRYDWSIRRGVRKAVAARAENLLWRYRDANGCRRSPAYFDRLAKELSTYHGVPYGYAGEPDEVFTLGSACIQRFEADAKVDDRNPTGHTPLHMAVVDGDLDAIQRLLAGGADVAAPIRSAESYSSEWGNTPLHLAARDGQEAIVRLLLGRGAPVAATNDLGVTPLHRAVRHPGVARILLDAGAKPVARDHSGRTPLHWAAAEPGGTAFIQRYASPATVKAIDHRGRSPLHDAATSGSAGNISALLAAGADPAAQAELKVSPLHLAAERGDDAVLTALLTRSPSDGPTDELGYTPLHLATRRGHLGAVELLLARGAQADVVDSSGTTPLHLAARHAWRTIADRLVARGASVKAANLRGTTPLHEAAFAGDRVLVDRLLARGAAADIADRRGRTPASVARKRGHTTLAGLLENRPVAASSQ